MKNHNTQQNCNATNPVPILIQSINCENLAINTLIKDWLESENWQFSDFKTFLELIGVETPVSLQDISNEERSFKCISITTGESFNICLHFTDGFEHASEIALKSIKNGIIETKSFTINHNFKDSKSIPSVELYHRTLQRNGNVLDSYYYKSYCFRTLTFPNNYQLIINIAEPKNNEDGRILIFNNCEAIEKYLIALDNCQVLAQVYCTIIDLLQFSDEDISNCESILFSYGYYQDENKFVNRSIIRLSYGQLMEYGFSEGEETYIVSSDKNWTYISDCITIIFNSQTEQYEFSILASKTKMRKITYPHKILSRVLKKINDIKKFF